MQRSFSSIVTWSFSNTRLPLRNDAIYLPTCFYPRICLSPGTDARFADIFIKAGGFI
ncbi:MAG: hypothetical protein R2788_14010 [Saprospiraceae bacterium]